MSKRRYLFFLFWGPPRKDHVAFRGKVANGAVNYCWESFEPIARPDESMLICLLQKKVLQNSSDNGFTSFWVPLEITEKNACLYIEVLDVQKETLELTHAFSQIYNNHIALISVSEKDKLTGLLSRHALEGKVRNLLIMQSKVQREIRKEIPLRQTEHNEQAWLVMFDIDHFKNVNDSFGHLCGDEVLLIFSQMLKTFFRSTDLIFRFGGEEFLLLMEPTSKFNAIAKVDSFRELVAETLFPIAGNITFSAGLTAASEDVFESILLDNADKALYYAKEHGRNQVHCFQSLVDSGKIVQGNATADVDLF